MNQTTETSPRPLSARIGGGTLLTAAIAIAVEASTFEVAFLTDPVGPKALPLLVAAILAAGGLAQLFRPDIDVAWPESAVLKRMAGAAGSFVGYAVVLPYVGFFLSTTAVVTALSLLYGGPPLKGTLAAAALSGALWLLFVSVLGLPLPIGDLWMR